MGTSGQIFWLHWGTSTNTRIKVLVPPPNVDTINDAVYGTNNEIPTSGNNRKSRRIDGFPQSPSEPGRGKSLTRTPSVPPKRGSANKITKRQYSPKNKLIGNFNQNKTDSISSLGPQPSEEDLFYLLIHKLKRRDEADAAAAALKERLETQVSALNQQKRALDTRAKDAESLCKKQTQEITCQRDLIERWKFRFGKLKSLVSSISGDIETLYKDKEVFKLERQSLGEENENIREHLNQMQNDSEKLRKQWNQHKNTIVGVQNEVSALEQALAVSKTQSSEKESMIIQQRNQVATLENYIWKYSNKQQKKSTVIDHKQTETLSKIDAIHKFVAECKGLHLALDLEITPGIQTCDKRLKELCETEYVKSADMEDISRVIRKHSDR